MIYNIIIVLAIINLIWQLIRLYKRNKPKKCLLIIPGLFGVCGEEWSDGVPIFCSDYCENNYKTDKIVK